MEKETIRNIRIEDFNSVSQYVDYVDDDIIVTGDTDKMPYNNETIRLNCLLFAYCVSGTTVLEINHRTYQMEAGTSMILLPNILLRHISDQSPCTLKIMGFSLRFLQNISNNQKRNLETGYYLYQNPILRSKENPQSYKVFLLYRQLIMTRIEEKDHPQRKQIIHYLMSALFHEIMVGISRQVPRINKMNRPEIRQSDYLFHCFIHKVMEDDGTHRSVSYYADQLCYSPKYLSTVVKEVSGRPPLHIINEHAIELIKYQLKHTQLSMKEIADQFDFSTPSFFGKFVKAHIGMSPQEYRNSIEE